MEQQRKLYERRASQFAPFTQYCYVYQKSKSDGTFGTHLQMLTETWVETFKKRHHAWGLDVDGS